MKLEEAKDRMLNRNNIILYGVELGTQQLPASVFIDSRHSGGAVFTFFVPAQDYLVC